MHQQVVSGFHSILHEIFTQFVVLHHVFWLYYPWWICMTFFPVLIKVAALAVVWSYGCSNGSEVILGWGLLSQFPPFHYFPIFLTLSKHTLPIEYHIYIWQVAPQLGCGDNCQIWMWFKESNRLFCKIESFAYGEINEQSFSNPHPWRMSVESVNTSPQQSTADYVHNLGGVLYVLSVCWSLQCVVPTSHDWVSFLQSFHQMLLVMWMASCRIAVTPRH